VASMVYFTESFLAAVLMAYLPFHSAVPAPLKNGAAGNTCCAV